MKTKFSPEVENALNAFCGPDLNFAIDVEAFRAEIARLEKELERENIQPRAFGDRITNADRLRVRGLGIRLD